MTSDLASDLNSDLNSGFAIRPAAPEDLVALAGLYRACLEAADWFPTAALAEIDFARDTTGELVLVAADPDGALLGFVGVWEPEAFIHHLYVAAPHRGRGIGRALLAALDGKIGYPWRLKCIIANRAAYRFYESLGWRETAREHGSRGEYALMQYG